MDWPISWNDVKERLEALEAKVFGNSDLDSTAKVISFGKYSEHDSADFVYNEATGDTYIKISDEEISEDDLGNCVLYLNVDSGDTVELAFNIVDMDPFIGFLAYGVKSCRFNGNIRDVSDYELTSAVCSNSGTYFNFTAVTEWYGNAFGMPGVEITRGEIRLNTSLS